MKLILKSFAFLQQTLTTFPDSGVDWVSPDYIFPANLLEDLTPDEAAILNRKLEAVGSSPFPEFVARCRKENAEFLSKISSEHRAAVFGGKISLSTCRGRGSSFAQVFWI